MALILFMLYIVGIFIFYNYVYRYYIVTIEKVDMIILSIIWPLVLIVWFGMLVEDSCISAYNYIYNFLKKNNII